VLPFRFGFSGITPRRMPNCALCSERFPIRVSESRLLQREADDTVTTLVTAGTAVSLTVGNWYTFKAVIDDDPGNSALQRLRFYVDGTEYLSTLVVDDDWSAGYVGLFRGQQTAMAEQFDDFKAGYDNNADGDIDDGGDLVHVSDSFDSNTATLTHDDAGNLTGDGVFSFTYDAWNRLAGKWYAGADMSDAGKRVARYEYDALHRRVEFQQGNSGSGIVAGSDAGGAAGVPAGDRSEHHYYDGRELVELRNGSGDTLWQVVYGVDHIDEPLRLDRNTDPSSDDDCLDGSGGSQAYYYHEAGRVVSAAWAFACRTPAPNRVVLIDVAARE
jgi:hypothetical protein